MCNGGGTHGWDTHDAAGGFALCINKWEPTCLQTPDAWAAGSTRPCYQPAVVHCHAAVAKCQRSLNPPGPNTTTHFATTHMTDRFRRFPPPCSLDRNVLSVVNWGERELRVGSETTWNEKSDSWREGERRRGGVVASPQLTNPTRILCRRFAAGSRFWIRVSSRCDYETGCNSDSGDEI